MFVPFTEDMRPKVIGQGKPFRGTLTGWRVVKTFGDKSIIEADDYADMLGMYDFFSTSEIKHLVQIDQNTWLVETRNSVYLLQDKKDG